MVLKRSDNGRQEREDEDVGTSQKRPRPWFDVTREIVETQYAHRLFTKMEPLFRKVVQEEVESALCRYAHSISRMPRKQIQSAHHRPYRLCFRSKLPNRLFTTSRIEAVGNTPVEISIIDTVSNEIITSDPLSTTKIDIVVLDGDFGGDEDKQWTEDEFSRSIIREREGKRPLLAGEVAITLNNGIGYLGNAIFTDNSSWTRSRKFRLGARVRQTRSSEGVHEAITEAFLVKDHRGESYMKHHPPALSDEVWRLEKIGKDGVFHKKLAQSGINTVQDILRFSFFDHSRLRNLLGNGMTDKKWDAILKNIGECVPSDKLYSYSGGQGVVLIFDSLFRLFGVRFNNVYCLLDDLNASQKVFVNELKELASRNPNDIVEFNEPLLGSLPRSLHTADVPLQEPSLPIPSFAEQFVSHQVEPVTHSSLQIVSQAPCYHHLEDQSLLTETFTRHILPPAGSSLPNSYTNSIDMQFGNFMNGLLEPMLPDDYLFGFNSGAGMSISMSNTMGWHHLQASAGNAETGTSYVSDLPASQPCILSGMWIKIKAALKWRVILKRLAAKRFLIEDLDFFGSSGLLSDVIRTGG